jgi:hypothetical protein
MVSKIISRAACLRELACNPKSFSNCPDLHGGAPGLVQDRICTKRALGKKGQHASQARRPILGHKHCKLPAGFLPVADHGESGNLFL